MMEGLRSWLLAVISVSLLCALADALMPRGPVRRVGRLVCGLVLLAALLSPIAQLDAAGGQRWLEDYFASVDGRAAELREELNGQMKVIIERECAAYIVDKAAELGWTCAAQVECRMSEDGLYLPCRAWVAGPLTEEERAGLTRMISEDLGVPESEQSCIGEEELP